VGQVNGDSDGGTNLGQRTSIIHREGDHTANRWLLRAPKNPSWGRISRAKLCCWRLLVTKKNDYITDRHLPWILLGSGFVTTVRYLKSAFGCRTGSHAHCAPCKRTKRLYTQTPLRLPINHPPFLPVFQLAPLHHDQERPPHGRLVGANLRQLVDEDPLALVGIDRDLALDLALDLLELCAHLRINVDVIRDPGGGGLDGGHLEEAEGLLDVPLGGDRAPEDGLRF
jgi:hypothetical protein